MASEPPRARQWEAAFVLLESGLCDRSLLHARLLRLLHLRASLSHRHRPASLFPPVLMLVENERQAEVWRWVARDAARTERVEELAGAIAILGEQDNPWQWGWRDLATGASLRLAARCMPQPQGALPPGVMAHLAAVRAIVQATDEADQQRVMPGGSARRVKLPAVIPLRERGLLTLLARAPLLAAEEIAAMLRRVPDGGPLSEATAERRLRDLARLGLARRDLVAQGRQAAWRWQLTERGLRQVAAIHDVPLLHLARRVERAEIGSPHVLESRDQFVLQRHGAHLAGVYGVVAAFHRAATASRGAITVAWWDTGRGCERTYPYHGVQRNLRPDAELELMWQTSGSPHRMRLWLEYDRGTMNQRDLARKMGAYADYAASKEWAAHGYAALPRLLFIVPETTQERRVREACVEQLAGTRLRVLVTTAAHLSAATPFGPIWRQILPIVPEGEQAARRALWE